MSSSQDDRKKSCLKIYSIELGRHHLIAVTDRDPIIKHFSSRSDILIVDSALLVLVLTAINAALNECVVVLQLREKGEAIEKLKTILTLIFVI